VTSNKAHATLNHRISELRSDLNEDVYELRKRVSSLENNTILAIAVLTAFVIVLAVRNHNA